MNEKNITRVSLEKWEQMKGKTDWEKIQEMTEAEIEQGAQADPDNQPTSDDFWDDAVVVYPSENLAVKEG